MRQITRIVITGNKESKTIRGTKVSNLIVNIACCFCTLLKDTDLITQQQMPILYSVISRGLTVLTKYASCAGNFAEVTEQIIEKIPSHDNKLTYSHGNYLFHYICENGIIYMCITDDVSVRETIIYAFVSVLIQQLRTVKHLYVSVHVLALLEYIHSI